MLYLYDEAIVNDLKKSFNTDFEDSVITVIGPDAAIEVYAQLQNDQLKFPAVVLARDNETAIDTERINFSRLRKGIDVVIDNETNAVYSERVMPVALNYTMTIYTTNLADMDELVREILFKYVQMYFLTIEIPYEDKRKIRFGISVTPDGRISRTSGTAEYLSAGKLYESTIPLKCEGAVLLNYVPKRLTRTTYEVSTKNRGETSETVRINSKLK